MRSTEAQAIQLADDVEILINWLSEDVLALAGPEVIERLELFDFIVTELKAREDLCPHRIHPVWTTLEKTHSSLKSTTRSSSPLEIDSRILCLEAVSSPPPGGCVLSRLGNPSKWL